MQRDSDRQGDEDAWRAIVENYGDRVQLEDEPPAAVTDAVTDPVSDADQDSGGGSTASSSGSMRAFDTGALGAVGPIGPTGDPGSTAGRGEVDDPEDRFVPPAPPPLPAVSRDRKAAWAGLFGSPAVLLVCLVVGFPLPALLAYALVAAFVGGFLYLVVTMPSGPADPWDDGARL